VAGPGTARAGRVHSARSSERRGSRPRWPVRAAGANGAAGTSGRGDQPALRPGTGGPICTRSSCRPKTVRRALGCATRVSCLAWCSTPQTLQRDSHLSTTCVGTTASSALAASPEVGPPTTSRVRRAG
jgi:hypothetical protein